MSCGVISIQLAHFTMIWPQTVCRNWLRSHREFLRPHPAQISDEARGIGNEARFVAFSSMWSRREVRTIGLHQNAIERNRARNFSQSPRVGKCHDAGERDVEAESQHKIRQLIPRREAMDDTTRGSFGLKKGYRVVIGLTRMDDDR